MLCLCVTTAHTAHAGRNIHALDPYRMPSASAEARGAAAGAAILDAHRTANAGALPETVAVNLWGLDSIKTRGDNVGLVLWLVGARPVKEGTGRIARFELVPLEELGRPRIDVLCNMSGIFRCAPRRPAAGCACKAAAEICFAVMLCRHACRDARDALLPSSLPLSADLHLLAWVQHVQMMLRCELDTDVR